MHCNQWNEILIHFGLLLIVWNISNIQSFSFTLLFQLFSQKDTFIPVGSTNITNVTTHAVVFSQQQTSQHYHQHQLQTSNNDKCHRVIVHKSDKRHNVTMFGVMMSYFCFVHVCINYGATLHCDTASQCSLFFSTFCIWIVNTFINSN